MRRFLALLSVCALAGSLLASNVEAASTRREARTNSFVGSFDMVEQGSGRLVAHVVAQFKEPTFNQLVPGSLDISWAFDTTADPYDGTGAPFHARESHAQVLRTAFWRGGGQTASEVDGYLCDYGVPGVASCHPFQMGFFTYDDPTTPRMVAFEGVEQWCCSGTWYEVGRGKFELTYFTDTPDFPWYPEPPAAAAITAPSAAPAPVGSLTASTARATTSTSSFTGNFDLLAYGSPARRVGHVTAQLRVPTFDQLVPGSLDISWASDAADTGLGWPPQGVRESHARVLATWFSPGSDGFTHARAEGVMCDYISPQNAACHGFQMDFAANDDPKAEDEVGFGPAESCCTGPFYVAGKGTFELAYVAPPERQRSRHVGASYMTFWGLEPEGADGTPPWSLPRSDSPLLGLYDSADPKVAERQITTALSHGVNLFFMDFGWIQPGDPLDLAAQTGLMRAKNIDLMDIAVMYFPDAVVSSSGEGPDRLRADFAYLAATYFTHPSYLRIDGRPVVVVNELTQYWWQYGVAGTNAMFAELKDKYDLYLVGGVWHDTDPGNVQGSPLDALTIWGNLWSSLGDDPDLTYTYGQYADAYRGYWSQWGGIAASDGLQFVPSLYPGFDNLTYTHAPYGQPHLVIGRDLTEFTSLAQDAKDMTTAPLNLTLLFSWNDFSEGHAIEPSVNYGDTYLEAIESTFAN